MTASSLNLIGITEGRAAGLQLAGRLPRAVRPAARAVSALTARYFELLTPWHIGERRSELAEIARQRAWEDGRRGGRRAGQPTLCEHRSFISSSRSRLIERLSRSLPSRDRLQW